MRSSCAIARFTRGSRRCSLRRSRARRWKALFSQAFGLERLLHLGPAADELEVGSERGPLAAVHFREVRPAQNREKIGVRDGEGLAQHILAAGDALRQPIEFLAQI